jgi:hypothetical protein
MKPSDLRGMRFGRLIALRDVGSVKNGASRVRLWECSCDCGVTTTKRSSQLLGGHCNSCGCFKSEVCRARVLLPPGASGFNALKGHYRAGAKRRNLQFSLSDTEFRALTSSPCRYCGAPPARLSKIQKGHTAYTYNGIDRANNSKGYTSDNCVPCCSTCNYLKGTKNIEEFCALIRRIATHLGTHQ